MSQPSHFLFLQTFLLLIFCSWWAASPLQADDLQTPAADEKQQASETPTLNELKAQAAKRSGFLEQQWSAEVTETPVADLETYRDQIEPILQRSCVACHGEEAQEGNIRIDSLDPDLFQGEDVSWWLEVSAVLSNGEMPPPDEGELSDEDRNTVIQWLASQLQLASVVRRSEGGHSSFRRMTRYEYNYALQDLLGKPLNFAKDLPPEPNSPEGFQNSSDLLQMSLSQFESYREANSQALRRVTVRGEQPKPLFWSVSMGEAAKREWAKQDNQLQELKEKFAEDPEKQQAEIERRKEGFRNKPNRTYFWDRDDDRAATASWRYSGAKYAWTPIDTRPENPDVSQVVAVIPARNRLIVELGNQLPDKGMLRVRVRAARTEVDSSELPSLQLEFGWQASNDSAAAVRISQEDRVIDADPDDPKFYQWEIPLSEIYPRNLVRKTGKMGGLPSPSELLKFVNSSISQISIQIDYVEISAPVYEQWPPASHHKIFVESDNKSDEAIYAKEVLTRFMTRAWRRPIQAEELAQKLTLFEKIRPQCEDFEEAIVEVLSVVLASPNFLYWVQAAPDEEAEARTELNQYELATRLAAFLWCSIPDQELLDLASRDGLRDPEALQSQVQRMLADPRSHRFSEQFVRQWLGMQLLDYLKVDRKVYPQFDVALREAMRDEPIAFFQEVLQQNHSVVDFIHADFTMVNERLANHYGLDGVRGNHLRRVALDSNQSRGGLLTQAGLLAMNSDGKDSHPLKRGIWMLESLLNDPPPPPPPAVPEIDLADPEILKLSLKERIEDHRNHAACLSCHAKIDPWGIAFENYDAVGAWRTEANGKGVDSSSVLFNGETLAGIDGLKRYLLTNRQDQFVRAMAHKLVTYAVGRPLTFGDRAAVDEITVKLRRQGDGLATMIALVVASDLFQSR